MAIEQLIKGAFSKAFNKYIYNEMVVGKLAHTELKTGKGKGDEVDIVMPGMVTTFAYDGGDLPEAEAVTTSVAKIKLDKGIEVQEGCRKKTYRRFKYGAPTRYLITYMNIQAFAHIEETMINF